MTSAGSHAMWLKMMKMTAATRLVRPARTFLAALMRWSSSSKKIPMMAIRSTPWAAPKYPP